VYDSDEQIFIDQTEVLMFYVSTLFPE